MRDWDAAYIAVITPEKWTCLWNKSEEVDDDEEIVAVSVGSDGGGGANAFDDDLLNGKCELRMAPVCKDDVFYYWWCNYASVCVSNPFRPIVLLILLLVLLSR